LGSFIFIAFFGGFVPTIAVTYYQDVNSYPGYLN